MRSSRSIIERKIKVVVFHFLLYFLFVVHIAEAMKIFSPSVARNKQPILDVLKPKLAAIACAGNEVVRMIEIASGSGEHAAFLATSEGVPPLDIMPVEPDADAHGSIEAWAADVPAASGSRIRKPINTDIRALTAEALPADMVPANAMLCVNMIHISPYECSEKLFEAASALLEPNGLLFTYGPYREGGSMVASNEDFDASLKSRDPTWGVRDIETVEATANARGLLLIDRVEMPANNLLLTWQASSCSAGSRAV